MENAILMAYIRSCIGIMENEVETTLLIRSIRKTDTLRFGFRVWGLAPNMGFVKLGVPLEESQ